jgi:hypothetical protein
VTLEGVEGSDLGEFKNNIPEFAWRNSGKLQEFHCRSGERASVQTMDPAHFEYETGVPNFQTGLVAAQWLELFSRNQSDSDIG